MVTIETYKDDVNKRWFAEIVGVPASRCEGHSLVEAVGKLIVAKARRIGLVINHNPSRDRLR